MPDLESIIPKIDEILEVANKVLENNKENYKFLIEYYGLENTLELIRYAYDLAVKDLTKEKLEGKDEFEILGNFWANLFKFATRYITLNYDFEKIENFSINEVFRIIIEASETVLSKCADLEIGAEFLNPYKFAMLVFFCMFHIELENLIAEVSTELQKIYVGKKLLEAVIEELKKIYKCEEE
jgi:hypothetical protein